jgi:hypothetical protein
MFVEVEGAIFGRDQHVFGVRHRLAALQRHDLAEVVAELVAGRHVVDAVTQLDHVAGLEPGKLHVERARRRVHRDRRIVGGAFAVLDRFIDFAVGAVHLRAAQLHDLSIGFVGEAVLAPRRRGGLGERLKHDLPELARQAVVEDGRDGQVTQGAARLARRRREALLQELVGVPSVGFVGARLGGLEVLDILAHVAILRANPQDFPQAEQLLVTPAELALQLAERAQRTDVFRSQLERALVRCGGALGLSERTIGARGYPERPLVGVVRRQQPLDPTLGLRPIAARDREIDHARQVVGVVEASRRVALLGFGRVGGATQEPQLARVHVEQVDRLRGPPHRLLQHAQRRSRQAGHVVELDTSGEGQKVVGIFGEHAVENRRRVAPVGAVSAMDGAGVQQLFRGLG